MSLKSVVVFLDSDPSHIASLRYAVKLVASQNAHLIGIFVAAPAWHGDGADANIRGNAAVRDMIDRHNAEERLASSLALKQFERESAYEFISYEFRLIRQSEADGRLPLHLLHADLAVIGLPAPAGLAEVWSAESLLLAAGVPVVVVPETWAGDTIAKNVVLAWNASREAKRAIRDSLPLLISADTVTILVVDPEKNASYGELPGADIAQHLSRHGAKVTVEQVPSQGRLVADVIRSYVVDHNADLLVLGAYSHARTREMVFGGVTRSLLKSVATPMLIAH